MKQRTLKLQRIYKEGSAYLESRQIPDAQIDAWYLLEYVTGISRASYYGNPEKNISEEEAKRYWEYLEKRARRIPLQHITGSQEFMGYEFLVNEHVLIPRQDTENLVEEALKVIRPDMYVLDMCTGSGCILISLLKYAAERKHITGGKAVGADISADALEVAKKNAKLAGVADRITFAKRDIKDFELNEGFMTVITNPPYGERLLDVKSAEELYKVMGEKFKRTQGKSYTIITPDDDFEKIFGRKADKRRKLYNGTLKCQLYMYFK